MTVGAVLRRFLLYMGLALGSLALIALGIALSVHTGIVVPGRWAALATFTLFLMGISIKIYRQYWAYQVFWWTLAGLLCTHVAVFILVLHNYPGFRAFWYMPVVIVEAQAFGVIFDRVLARETANRRRNHGSRL